jgi:hypothetical protein
VIDDIFIHLVYIYIFNSYRLAKQKFVLFTKTNQVMLHRRKKLLSVLESARKHRSVLCRQKVECLNSILAVVNKVSTIGFNVLNESGQRALHNTDR